MTYPLTAKPSEQKYWDRNLETRPRAQWEALKLILLQKHLRHAYEGSPYYKASFDAAGVHPDKVKSLADLRHFPLMTKQTIRERQLAVPPFGDLVAVPERDIVYISASSGSTGQPTASPFTAGDFDDWMDYEARQFWSSGMRPEDRYCHSLNFSLFVGGPCVIGAQKLGALCIHAGTVPSERLLAILRQFQATIIWTTPSYAWYLGETAVKEGIDPRKDLAVKRIFVAGEPGGSIPRRASASRRCGARMSMITTAFPTYSAPARACVRRRTACIGPRITSWPRCLIRTRSNRWRRVSAAKWF